MTDKEYTDAELTELVLARIAASSSHVTVADVFAVKEALASVRLDGETQALDDGPRTAKGPTP